MRGLFLLLTLPLIVNPALAAEPSGCDKFAWRLDKERQLLSEAKPALATDALDRDKGRAISIDLQPWPTAKLPVPPEREPRKTPSWAGFVQFAGASGPGRYKISLSEGAWVDIIQDAHNLKPLAFTGATDCRTSVKACNSSSGPAPSRCK